MITLKKMLLLSCIIVSTIHAHENYRFVTKGATHTGDWIVMPDSSIQFTATSAQQAKTVVYTTAIATILSALIYKQGNNNEITTTNIGLSLAVSALANYIVGKHVLNDGNSGIQVTSTLLGAGLGFIVAAETSK